MHLNHYFLRPLAAALNERLRGSTLLAAFSQSRDELVLGFGWPDGREYYVRAELSPEATFLSFPDTFHRAKKNSVDLLPDAVGATVTGARAHRNERSFAVYFADGQQLVFKLFGQAANVVLFDADGTVADLFRHRLEDDWQLDATALDRPLAQDRAAFEAAGHDYRPLFPTFGPLPRRYLSERGYPDADADTRWALVQEVVGTLESPRYYLVDLDGQARLSLLPLGTVRATHDDPIAAANAYAAAFVRTYYLSKEKAEVLRLLDRRLKQTRNYLNKTRGRLEALTRESRPEELANILMANLHAVPPGASSVRLYDFYRDAEVDIPLSPETSPQKNAERYYRKAKNQGLELDKLRENIEQKEVAQAELTRHREAVVAATGVRDLRKYRQAHGLDRPGTAAAAPPPFRKFAFEGYEIWVGRNARSNDVLIQQYAHKEDLWLHARDASGSHVVVKQRAGKPFPAPVVQRAAELAAYYSKRKTDSLCPVIVTPRKYVRKVKGALPGAVAVDREEVVMVAPRSAAEAD